MDRKKVLRIRILGIIVLVLTMSFSNLFAIIEWDDTDQLYRQEINITGTTSSIDNLTHTFKINSSLVGTNFNFSAHRDSIRFYYYNQTSSNTTLIGHWVKTWSNSNKNGTIMIKIPFLNTTEDAKILMYYGDTSKSNSEDYCSVFIYCDNFNDGTINSKLTTTDQDTVSGTSFSEGSGVLSITAGGADTWTGSDQYGSVFVNNIKGDVDIRLSIISQTNPNSWCKAGIMVKNDMTASTSSTGYSFNVRTPGNGYSFQRDENNNGYLDSHTGMDSSTNPSYLRLIKSGTTHTGYYSKTSPNTWTQINSRTISSTNNIQDIGISLTSHAGSTLATATYDNFTIRRYTTDSFSESFGNEEKLANELKSITNNPSITTISNILQNNTFLVNITISCKGIDSSSNCGNVTGILKYNNSGTYSQISQNNSTPLWTNNINPQNCIIGFNSSCDFIWYVNATGIKNSIEKIHAEFTSNQTNIENINSSDFSIKIVVSNTVNFNQSTYTFENFTKNSGDKNITLKVIADNGNNTNIIVECQSGNCSKITNNWVDGTNLNEGNNSNIQFTCSDQNSGNYNAIFNLTSDEFDGFATISINCNILPIYGPMIAYLNNPTQMTTTTISQNQTFNLNASISCTGICGNITAYAIYEREDWWNLSWFYRKKLNISINDNIPTNYQILLELNNSNLGPNFDWNNNCNDLRFINKSNELDYWIEECNSTKKEIFVWIETQSALNSNTDYLIDLYYGNNEANSKSNATKTFKQNSIYLITGRCSGSGNCDMDNHGEANTLRANINSSGMGIDGTGYRNGINDIDNPYGSNDGYYSRYRLLFIPSNTNSYQFGSYTDDDSEITLFPKDGYGNGIQTGTPYGNHDIITTQYNTWHNSNACGSTPAIEGTRNLISGKGYWIDFLHIEGSGGEDQVMCLNQGSGYNTFTTTNYPDQIFARNYVNNEPQLISVGIEDNLYIDTNSTKTPFWSQNSQPQSCIPIEDGSCSFKWDINATGLINTSYNVSVYFKSNISSISNKLTNHTTIEISDNIIPEINLHLPTNNSKYLGNGIIKFMWEIKDDDSQINSSLYINGNYNQTLICNTGTNCSINLTLNSGKYNWSILVNDSKSNTIMSSTNNFWNILNYSSKITKQIIFENTNLYKINLNITNNVNFDTTITPIDFKDVWFSGGSFNPIFTWQNDTIGNYFGKIYGWNKNISANSSENQTYLTTGIANFNLQNNFIIGLE